MRNFLKIAALLAAPALLAPHAALALPAVGDIVGTNAEDATASLAEKGCTVTGFEAEDGKIEALCTDDATGKPMEIMIDPASGAVTAVEGSDE